MHTIVQWSRLRQQITKRVYRYPLHAEAGQYMLGLPCVLSSTCPKSVHTQTNDTLNAQTGSPVHILLAQGMFAMGSVVYALRAQASRPILALPEQRA